MNRPIKVLLAVLLGRPLTPPCPWEKVERRRVSFAQRWTREDPDVRVILDRRYGERRQRNAPPGVDRRLKYRRSLDIEKHILQIGWAIADEKSHVEGET